VGGGGGGGGPPPPPPPPAPLLARASKVACTRARCLRCCTSLCPKTTAVAAHCRPLLPAAACCCCCCCSHPPLPSPPLRSLLSTKAGSRLVLADPPNRTPKNRERFMELLRASPGGWGNARARMCALSTHAHRSSHALSSPPLAGLRLSLEECSMHNCESELLDTEMAGGSGPAGTSSSIPIQLSLLRATLGGDTIGVKPQ
jgi:hypothetical protein